MRPGSDINRAWEHFEHGADIGVRGVGPTKESAFEEVALALTGVITDPASVRSQISVAIECEAPDDELLAAEWLNALIYQMATRRMLFGAFEVGLEGWRLKATAWGEPVVDAIGGGGWGRSWPRRSLREAATQARQWGASMQWSSS